jgi:hypothetical protein
VENWGDAPAPEEGFAAADGFAPAAAFEAAPAPVAVGGFAAEQFGAEFGA